MHWIRIQSTLCSLLQLTQRKHVFQYFGNNSSKLQRGSVFKRNKVAPSHHSMVPLSSSYVSLVAATLHYETQVLYICHRIGHWEIIDTVLHLHQAFQKKPTWICWKLYPKYLAKYASIIALEEMYVKEGLFLNKHTGALIDYSGLSEINNILLDYEQHLENSGRTPRPLAKCMLVFMVRGLFTSLKFPYMQYPTSGMKGLIFFLWFGKL